MPMHAFPCATAQFVSTRVSHTIRTLAVRDDLVGWVVSGAKRLSAPQGEHRFATDQVFLMPRGTHWDVVNEAIAGKGYEARLISFSPELIETFFDRYRQFSALRAIQGSGGTSADQPFVATFQHACSALRDGHASAAVREHRSLEVLLLLAERGLVFSSTREMTWADRVCRLVGQRPHANWSVDALALAFNVSSSTLRRRLSGEGTSVSQCVRDMRLETAMSLLQGTSLQVSEIAGRCGYDSHSRFSAAFRQRFGFAPSRLRS